jgi:putative ATPase
MRQFGYGQGYRYAHDEPGHYARDERYLPEELGRPQYYVPGDIGFEARAAERLAGLKKPPAPIPHKRKPDED